MCRRPLYRSRSGMIFGVCQGLAKYSEIPVLWVRMVMCALFLLFFPAAAFFYLLAAVLMKPEPVMPPATLRIGISTTHGRQTGRSQSLESRRSLRSWSAARVAWKISSRLGNSTGISGSTAIHRICFVQFPTIGCWPLAGRRRPGQQIHRHAALRVLVSPIRQAHGRLEFPECRRRNRGRAEFGSPLRERYIICQTSRIAG